MFLKNQFLAAARLETFMFDNVPMDKIGLKDTRLSNLEYLGNDMIEAGNEFGPGTPYGKGHLGAKPVPDLCQILQAPR